MSYFTAAPLRLYWHEDYPESLYCLGYDIIERAQALYVLTSPKEAEVDTGTVRFGNDLFWHKCSWNAHSEKAIKGQGFEFIGEL